MQLFSHDKFAENPCKCLADDAIIPSGWGWVWGGGCLSLSLSFSLSLPSPECLPPSSLAGATRIKTPNSRHWEVKIARCSFKQEKALLFPPLTPPSPQKKARLLITSRLLLSFPTPPLLLHPFGQTLKGWWSSLCRGEIEDWERKKERSGALWKRHGRQTRAAAALLRTLPVGADPALSARR